MNGDKLVNSIFQMFIRPFLIDFLIISIKLSVLNLRYYSPLFTWKKRFLLFNISCDLSFQLCLSHLETWKKFQVQGKIRQYRKQHHIISSLIRWDWQIKVSSQSNEQLVYDNKFMSKCTSCLINKNNAIANIFVQAIIQINQALNENFRARPGDQ